MESFRVKLDFTNLTCVGVYLNQCWFLVNRSKINSVSDLRTEICRRFKLQHNPSALKIYLQNCEVLLEESIQILRDDDLLVLKYDINHESLKMQQQFSAVAINDLQENHSTTANDHIACDGSHRKKKKKKMEINETEVNLTSSTFNLEFMDKQKRRRKQKKVKDDGNDSPCEFSVHCFDSSINKKRKKKKHKTNAEASENSVLENNADMNEIDKNGNVSRTEALSFAIIAEKSKEKTTSKQKQRDFELKECDNSFFDSKKVDLRSRHQDGLMQDTQLVNTEKESHPANEELCPTKCMFDTETTTDKKKRKRKRKRKGSSPNQINILKNSFSETKKITENFEENLSLPNINFKNKIFIRNKHIHFDTNNDDEASVHELHKVETNTLPDAINSKELSNGALQQVEIASKCTDENASNEKELKSVEETRDKKDEEPRKQKINYSELRDLLHPPRAGDIIAFKELVLSEAYSPEVSDYKEGKVISYDDASGVLEIDLTEELIQPVKSGKFEIEAPDDSGINTVKKVYHQFSSLIEPKIVNLTSLL